MFISYVLNNNFTHTQLTSAFVLKKDSYYDTYSYYVVFFQTDFFICLWPFLPFFSSLERS